jgi:phenylalanine-4-hydroxylase
MIVPRLGRQVYQWRRFALPLSSCHARWYKSTSDMSRLNEDNMIAHHMTHEVPPQEWATFNGKISILQQVNDEARDDYSLYGETPRTSVLMELKDRVGVLHDVLRYFWKYDVNICRIESRPLQVGPQGERRFDFFVDLEGSPGDKHVSLLLDALKPMTDKLLILDEKRVHWFPRHIAELDLIADRTLDAGVDLESDHPGFKDMHYRARRAELTQSAINHRWNKPIQRIHYTPEETSVWTAVWDKMDDLWGKYACKEYLKSLQLMKDNCGYSRETIPQQQDISDFMMSRTNFRLRPVAGLLSSRDFLNGMFPLPLR